MREKARHHEETYDPIGVELLIGILALTVTSVGAYLSAIPLLERRAKKSAMLLVLRGIRDQADLLANTIDDFIRLIENAQSYHPNLDFMSKACTVRGTLLKLKLRDYRRWYEINDKLSQIRTATSKIHARIEQINLQEGQTSGLIAYDDNLIEAIDDAIIGLSRRSILELAVQLREIVDKVSSRTHEILSQYM